MITTANLGNLVRDGLESINILYPMHHSVFEIIEPIGANANAGSLNPLKKISVTDLPTNNTWIFDSEPNKKCFGDGGNKVEKSILHIANNKLYVVMIEMKSTMNKKNLASLADKFVCSLTRISIFLSGNSIFTTPPNLRIVPIGVACFNQRTITEDDTNRSDTCKAFNTLPIQFKNKTSLPIAPITLNQMSMQVLYFQNPNFIHMNEGSSDNFALPFSAILPPLLQTSISQ